VGQALSPVGLDSGDLCNEQLTVHNLKFPALPQI